MAILSDQSLMDRRPLGGWLGVPDKWRGDGRMSACQMMCLLVVDPKVRVSVERMSNDIGKVEANSAIMKRRRDQSDPRGEPPEVQDTRR